MIGWPFLVSHILAWDSELVFPKRKPAMAVHAADYKLKSQKTKCSAKYIEKCIALDATDTVAQPGQAVGRLRLVVPEGSP
jgi:hypothetical protein